MSLNEVGVEAVSCLCSSGVTKRGSWVIGVTAGILSD